MPPFPTKIVDPAPQDNDGERARDHKICWTQPSSNNDPNQPSIFEMADDDKLCDVCAGVPLYSLFTGPRSGDREDGLEYEPIDGVLVATLDQVWANLNCPLCRMVKQIVGPRTFELLSKVCEPSGVGLRLWPERADDIDEMSFVSAETRRLVGTRLAIHPEGLPHLEEEVRNNVGRYRPTEGIQLLSPGSIDPARPLQNGFVAATMDENLELLRTWIDECEQHHLPCRAIDTIPESHALPAHIRAIDVCNHTLIEIDPAVTRYATLSYVWGQDSAAYSSMAAEIDADTDHSHPLHLPATIPKIIQDAMTVCVALHIPYLWVDLYCIDQADLTRKTAEIALMGHIYRSSRITLVCGAQGRELLPSAAPPLDPAQRVESIHSRTYVTQAPTLWRQVITSPWIERSWTFQEGHLARRVAYFGGSDPSFVCGSGHWRPSLHSGPCYGHSANIPGMDLAAGGFDLLGGHKWLATGTWRFHDYARIVLNYSRRKLSFETDKLAALMGCLRLIEERKGMNFVWGLPTADFHYALLWEGEDGPRRAGFPSWSWAGWWTKMNTTYLVQPDPKDGEIGAGRLMRREDGGFGYEWEGDQEVQLSGLLLIPGFGKTGGWNRCRQRLANVRVSPAPHEVVRVESEGARFWLEFKPDGDGCGGDVCCKVMKDGDVDALDPEGIYRLKAGNCPIGVRDKVGNLYHSDYQWLSRWPLFSSRPPRELSGKEVRWLMEEGLDLIKVVEIELIEGHESLKPFRHVVCLGIDRTWDKGVEGRGRRMGVYSIPGDLWDKAGPEKMVVELW